MSIAGFFLLDPNTEFSVCIIPMLWIYFTYGVTPCFSLIPETCSINTKPFPIFFATFWLTASELEAEGKSCYDKSNIKQYNLCWYNNVVFTKICVGVGGECYYFVNYLRDTWIYWAAYLITFWRNNNNFCAENDIRLVAVFKVPKKSSKLGHPVRYQLSSVIVSVPMCKTFQIACCSIAGAMYLEFKFIYMSVWQHAQSSNIFDWNMKWIYIQQRLRHTSKIFK